MKLFKKTFSIYVLLTILGVVCIGLGCAISTFELSNYKIADYSSISADASQPQLKSEVVTLEAPLSGSEPFQLDAPHWNARGFDIQYDNTLTDKVLIEVSAPEDIYSIALHQADMAQKNYYHLECDPDEFALMRLALNLAKQGYIANNYPPAEVKLIMSEAQAKNFKLNEMQSKIDALEQHYYSEIETQQEQYNHQLSDVHTQFNEQIAMMNEQHEEELASIRQQYEDQLMQKNEEIENLHQQLNEVRNSLQ